jgi:hypothetical protein
MKKPTLEQAVKALEHNENFQVIVEFVAGQKEASLSELYRANTDQVQQISGELIASDRILKVFRSVM